VSEWIIVAIIGVVLLFSAKKLPDMARGLGQSMRIFKAETRGMREDDKKAAPASSGSEEQPVLGQSAPGRAAGAGTGSGTTAPSAPGVSNSESQTGGSSAS